MTLVQSLREYIEELRHLAKITDVILYSTVAADLDKFIEYASLAKDGQIVIDHQTGLMWAANESAERMDFATAEKYCKELKLGTYSDWRLPELHELESIREIACHNPCINTDFFKSYAHWVWTSTPCAWSSDRAWIVHFYYGAVYDGLRSDRAFVRAVRRVSPAGQ